SVAAVEGKLASVAGELAQWRALSLSTDHDHAADRQRVERERNKSSGIERHWWVCTKGADMAKGFFSRGFLGRRRDPEQAGRLPPGQYLTNGFPVLSAGPTPYTPKDKWDFTVVGAVETPQRWTWDEFQQLPREPITADIHCV